MTSNAVVASADTDLNDFFREIENLEISSSDDVDDKVDRRSSRVLAAQGGGPSSSSTAVSPLLPSEAFSPNNPVVAPPKASKETLVHRAEKHQQSWQEFTIAQSEPKNEVDDNKKKISFSLKTKNTKKRRGKASQKSSNTAATATNRQPSLPLLAALPPRKPQWVAVLDTCAVLEASFLDLVRSLMEAANIITIEPLTFVVPYKLWSELDYQSKFQGNLQQQARRAVWMLNQAMQHQQQRQRQHRIHSDTTGDGSPRHTTNQITFRSQSRADMNQAASDFGLVLDDDANNDDHILCCARAEKQQQHKQEEKITIRNKI